MNRRSTSAQRAHAAELAAKGWSCKEIGEQLGFGESTVQGWLSNYRRPSRPRSRVGYDEIDDCWRIYIRDPERDPEMHVNVGWWPIKWLRFGNEEYAEWYRQHDKKRLEMGL